MEKIFIDCGGNNGCSVRKWRKEYDINKEYYIYTFEPNPMFKKKYDNIEKHTLIQKACHISDGIHDFYIDRRSKKSCGSSLLDKKKNIMNNCEKIQIECINFPDWLSQFCNKNYKLILKMDIEGSEYDVLRKIIDDGNIGYIEKLYVEWHYKRVGVPRKTHESIIEEIKSKNVYMEKWDSLKY